MQQRNKRNEREGKKSKYKETALLTCLSSVRLRPASKQQTSRYSAKRTVCKSPAEVAFEHREIASLYLYTSAIIARSAGDPLYYTDVYDEISAARLSNPPLVTLFARVRSPQQYRSRFSAFVGNLLKHGCVFCACARVPTSQRQYKTHEGVA